MYQIPDPSKRQQQTNASAPPVVDVGTLLAANLSIDPSIELEQSQRTQTRHHGHPHHLVQNSNRGNSSHHHIVVRDVQHQQLRRALQHQQHQQQQQHHHHHHQQQQQQINDGGHGNTPGSEFLVDDKNGDESFEPGLTDPNGQEPQAQQPIDPKKTCPFCGRTFSHPGSLGRHLDLKRGTRLHPAPRVDLIRGDVKRRGDAVEIRARRAKRAKLYNAREDVKQRARMRRKMKEQSDRAKEMARSNFVNRIGQPELPPHPSFAYMVLYFLAPAQWPHDPPTKQTYEQVERALGPIAEVDPEIATYQSRLEVAFEQWSVMNMQTKLDIWAREQRRAAEVALGTLTLFDLGAREKWLAIEENRLFETMDMDPDDNPIPLGNTTQKNRTGSSNDLSNDDDPLDSDNDDQQQNDKHGNSDKNSNKKHGLGVQSMAAAAFSVTADKHVLSSQSQNIDDQLL